MTCLHLKFNGFQTSQINPRTYTFTHNAHLNVGNIVLEADGPGMIIRIFEETVTTVGVQNGEIVQ